MSDSPPERQGWPTVPPPPPRSGCLTAVLVVVGIILLLPGLCAVIFGAMSLSNQRSIGGIMPLVIFGLLVGLAGIMLIADAIRGPRS